MNELLKLKFEITLESSTKIEDLIESASNVIIDGIKKEFDEDE